jgi:hypothetical protein
MIRIRISLDARAYRELKAQARRQGISIAELTRRAVAEIRQLPTRRRGRPWIRYAGALSSGDPRASITADDVVYARPRP